jgi:hypothetical protein
MPVPTPSKLVLYLIGVGLCVFVPRAAAQEPIQAPTPEIVTAPRPLLAPEEIELAKPKPPPPPPDRWDLSTEVSLTDQSGNRVLRLFTGALKFSHREKKAYRLDGRIQSRYGKSEGEVVARNHYSSLAFDLHPGLHWSPFLSAEAERDPIKRLDLRLNGGAGATFTPFQGNDRRSATISLGLIYSYENLSSKEPESVEPDPRFLSRWNLRVQGQQKVQSSVTLSMLSLYQPAVGESGDYLLRTEAGAKVSLTKRLGLSVEYQLNRNAQPPTDVAPNDRLLKTGLVVDF